MTPTVNDGQHVEFSGVQHVGRKEISYSVEVYENGLMSFWYQTKEHDCIGSIKLADGKQGFERVLLLLNGFCRRSGLTNADDVALAVIIASIADLVDFV